MLLFLKGLLKINPPNLCKGEIKEIYMQYSWPKTRVSSTLTRESSVCGSWHESGTVLGAHVWSLSKGTLVGLTLVEGDRCQSNQVSLGSEVEVSTKCTTAHCEISCQVWILKGSLKTVPKWNLFLTGTRERTLDRWKDAEDFLKSIDTNLPTGRTDKDASLVSLFIRPHEELFTGAHAYSRGCEKQQQVAQDWGLQS